jgi:Domain of unknown function (DUF6378)
MKFNVGDRVCISYTGNFGKIITVLDEGFYTVQEDGGWVGDLEDKLLEPFTLKPYFSTKFKREEILDTAKKYVTSDRNKTHGEPEDSFGMIAKLWSAYTEKEFTSVDVCVLLALLKVARIKNMPTNEDNWVDLAGYSACGGELAAMTPNYKLKLERYK